MKTISLCFIFLILATLLAAQPTYVPMTTLAEDFGATWCTGCPISWQGLQVLHSNTHNGELISAKLYTESGALSSPEVQTRFDYYGVIGIPSVIFNGKIKIDGNGDGIGDGTLYNAALNQFRYSSAPIRINIGNFSTTTGTLAGSITMVSPTEVINDARVVYYLLENSVSAEDTHVLRAVLYDTLNLSGAGTVFNFNKSFTLNPAWNSSNLWAIAFVQQPSKSIIQSASTLAQPSYNFRCAMNWNNMGLTSDANYNFNSLPLWFYNQGLADDYTMRIDVDSAPADWYFNYCDDQGNCYPGTIDVPFSLAAGESRNFHLNLSIGTEGSADFRIVVSSSHIGSYSIPFHFYTTGSAADDSSLSPAPVQLGRISPNPLSKSGKLTLIADKSYGGAIVDVFNLRGQKVQTLPLGMVNPGENEISFTPAPILPNGVYFYRLQGSSAPAGRFVLVR